MGASLYKLCVPSAFGGKAGFDMDAKYFSSGCTGVTTLVQGVTGDGGEPGLSWDFPSAQWPLSGVGSAPSCCSRSPGVERKLALFPLMCVFSLPTLGPLPWSQGSAKAEGGS